MGSTSIPQSQDMPRHLRIVIGIFVITIILDVVLLGFFPRIFASAPILNQLSGTVIFMALIKGFRCRSIMAWYTAKWIMICSMALNPIVMVVVWFTPGVPPLWLALALAWSALWMGIDMYVLWVLYSGEVRQYFVSGN
jgi:hypothetical protein